MKTSVWVGTTPAETSVMPTTAIEDNELDTKALSNSSNCPHSTSCANPTPLNDPQAKPECHFLSDNNPITLTLTFVKPFGFLQFLLGKLFQVLRIVSAQCCMTVLLCTILKLPLGYSLPSEKSRFELTFEFMFEM
jgi:hypothetical protein